MTKRNQFEQKYTGVDEIDRELLRLLRLDARRPAAELARHLNVSRVTVQNRIDKLVTRGVIKGFTINTGDDADTLLIDAIVMIVLEPGDSRKTIQDLKYMSEVVAVHSVNGNYDFVLDVQTTSLARLDDVVMDIRRMPRVADTNSCIRLKRFK